MPKKTLEEILKEHEDELQDLNDPEERQDKFDDGGDINSVLGEEENEL